MSFTSHNRLSTLSWPKIVVLSWSNASLETRVLIKNKSQQPDFWSARWRFMKIIQVISPWPRLKHTRTRGAHNSLPLILRIQKSHNNTVLYMEIHAYFYIWCSNYIYSLAAETKSNFGTFRPRTFRPPLSDCLKSKSSIKVFIYFLEILLVIKTCWRIPQEMTRCVKAKD